MKLNIAFQIYCVELLHFILRKQFVYFLNLCPKDELKEVVSACHLQALLHILRAVCDGSIYSPRVKIKLDIITTKFPLFRLGFESTRDALMCFRSTLIR